MFSAILLVLGALSASNAYGYYGAYPSFYSGYQFGAYPWTPAAPGYFRTQYHTQANYAPYAYAAPALTYAAAPAPAAVEYKSYAAPTYYSAANQYHSQNSLGEAAYGYSFPGQAHTAVRDALGGVTGSYSYIGAEGKPVQVNYRADSANGFQVSSNVLPVAPKADLVQPVNDLVAPSPVDYTDEVKAAREEHFKAVEAAKAQPGYSAGDDQVKSRKKRHAVFYNAAPIAAAFHPYGYHAAAPYFYSGYAHPYSYPLAYNYAAPAVVKTEFKTLKPVDGTPASTYKFDLE